MDAQPGRLEEFGSVKAAISLCKERIHGGKAHKYRTQIPLPEELHTVDNGRWNEGKMSAEEERTRLESELYIARNTAKALAQKIEESKAKAMARRQQLHSLESSEGSNAKAPLNLETSLGQYSEVSRELDHVKQELSRLKLDVASASDAKAKAEKEIKTSDTKARMCSSYLEELKEKIGEANEEQVLVDLATMEAEREFRETEAQRAAEAVQFSKTMEKTRRRIEDLCKEIDRSKELEKKLMMTTSDVNVLQNEMVLLRAMERNFQKNQSKRKEEEMQASSLLQAAEVELEAAKKELARIKDEGFQCMASMDLVRGELQHIAEESERLKKLKSKADSDVQYLNSKLLKAKFKLEYALKADERTKAIISNLSLAQQQLQTDIKEAKKETELSSEESRAIKMETEITDLGIDSTEARLQSATEELEAMKASEATALEKLRTVVEKRMRVLAHSSQYSSTITVSKFEYKYLRGRAEGAQEVADKKVEAAQVWIEALEARVKEISLRDETTQREIGKLRVLENREIDNRIRNNKEAKSLELQFAVVMPRNLRGENGVPGESSRAKIRSSVSSGRRRSITRSPSFTIRKRRRVVTNLVRFLRGRRIGKLNRGARCSEPTCSWS